jgi:carbamoyltransferase
MKILGISAFYHDSAAAIIENGEIIAAAQEERFTRKKHDPNFPSNAVKFCLEYCGTTIDKLDAIAFYDKPLLKFERLLETYYAFVPRGLSSFITAIPVWLKEKMFLKRLIYEELAKIQSFDKGKVKLLFPEHHLSHAASAYYSSPFNDAAILTIDGVGEWATASICHGTGKDIKILKELKFPHSLGLLYSAFTYFLGFKVNSGEYKLMGLAPYGVPGSKQVADFVEIIKKNLVEVKDDGSVWLNQDYFNYATGLRMVHEDKWEKLFGFKTRRPEAELEAHHCNLGLAIQHAAPSTAASCAPSPAPAPPAPRGCPTCPPPRNRASTTR